MHGPLCDLFGDFALNSQTELPYSKAGAVLQERERLEPAQSSDEPAADYGGAGYCRTALHGWVEVVSA